MPIHGLPAAGPGKGPGHLFGRTDSEHSAGSDPRAGLPPGSARRPPLSFWLALAALALLALFLALAAPAFGLLL